MTKQVMVRKYIPTDTLYATVFNGTNTSIDIGSHATIDDLPLNKFTVEGWFYYDTDNTTRSSFISSCGSGLSGWDFYSSSATSIKFEVLFDTTNATLLVSCNADDLWHHFCASFDGTAVSKIPRIWVDGTEILANGTSGVGTYLSDAATSKKIGTAAGFFNFTGKVGWVRISDNIRYDKTSVFTPIPRYIMPVVDSHTVRLFLMNEGTGTTITDSSANAQNGTLANGTWAEEPFDWKNTLGYNRIFYVDPDSIAEDGAGTYSRPWTSLTDSMAFSAYRDGDVVSVKKGTYAWGDTNIRHTESSAKVEYDFNGSTISDNIDVYENITIKNANYGHSTFGTITDWAMTDEGSLNPDQYGRYTHKKYLVTVSGTTINGINATVKDSVIRNFSQGVYMGASVGDDGKQGVIDGCVIYYNGQWNTGITPTPPATDEEANLDHPTWVYRWGCHGHGFYVKQHVIIKNCIIFCNGSQGIQVYGGSHEDVQILNSISFRSLLWPMETKTIGGFTEPHGGDTGNNVWYSSTTDSKLEGVCTYDKYPHGNNYYGMLAGSTLKNCIMPEGITNGITYPTTEEQAIAILGADNCSGNLFGDTSTDTVRVMPYRNRALVAVYNWSEADSVTVDLSTMTGLNVGDQVTMISAQDYYVDRTVHTLDANKQISVDMRAASHTVETPQGLDAPVTTFPIFGAFQVIPGDRT